MELLSKIDNTVDEPSHKSRLVHVCFYKYKCFLIYLLVLVLVTHLIYSSVKENSDFFQNIYNHTRRRS
jgi:hypothetical protein